MIRSQRSPYGTSLLGAGAVHHIKLYALKDPASSNAQFVIVPKNARSPPPVITEMFLYPSAQHLGELRAR